MDYAHSDSPVSMRMAAAQGVVVSDAASVLAAMGYAYSDSPVSLRMAARQGDWAEALAATGYA